MKILLDEHAVMPTYAHEQDAGLDLYVKLDADYTGSIRVVLFNHGEYSYTVMPGDKIAQMVIAPCLRPPIEVVDSLDPTQRGAHGFGSTGRSAMSRDPIAEIASFDIPNPFKPRSLYDFELCVGILELKETIGQINRSGYLLIGVTQYGETYTVFFRRPAA